MNDEARQPVYLDHNGTTPVDPAVADAMWPYLTTECGNPSSASPSGRRAKAAVEHAREQVAELIGASANEVVFTSGGTEANNLAIRGVAAALDGDGVAVTSAVEHPATSAPMELLSWAGWRVHALGVSDDGVVDCDEFPSGRVDLGSLILAQNETGAIQPVPTFSDRLHAAGGLVHTDAAQAVGKIDVDVNRLGVDLLSIAGHKLYAPKAVGALFVRRSTRVAPVVVGAGQERGLRPGTENVAGIVGLGVAAELARSRRQDDAVRMQRLRDELWARLSDAVPGLVRISPSGARCLPNTLMVSLPGRLGRDVLEAAPAIEASTGSACHAGVDSPAQTLLAMGLDVTTALGAVRLSVGRSTTDADVDVASRALASAFTRG